MFIPKPVAVSKYDSVEMDYTIWESDEAETYDLLNPVFDTIVWVTMIPITDNDTTGLILGLYNNLLGKGLYYDSGLVWLNKCIDQNRDGIDDNTEQPALTYGNSTDQYFNTCLMIQFKILNIQKFTPPVQVNFTNIYVLRIIMFVILGVLGVILGILPVYFIRNRIRKSKKKPRFYYYKSSSVKSRIFKYSILTGSLTLISYFFLYPWLRHPLADLNMMLSNNPSLLPFLVTVTITICIGFTIIYLLAYRIIIDKIKKSEKLKNLDE
jgi:hypothetical protein